VSIFGSREEKEALRAEVQRLDALPLEQLAAEVNDTTSAASVISARVPARVKTASWS
jgi:hypothetical protein